MKLTFSADLFRIAYTCVSTEETRYYLNGVFVTPAPDGEGALLVSTDGHRLLIVRDTSAEGVPARGVILQAGKDALKQFKTGKGGLRRVAHVTIEDEASIATVRFTEGAEFVGAAPLAVVDGSFPDFMRIVPRLEDTERPLVNSINGAYLADFAKIGKELQDVCGDGVRARFAPMSINSGGPDSPALVGWGASIPALGVVMPIRGDVVTFPTWLETSAKRRAQAA
jgi:hypothetical protein